MHTASFKYTVPQKLSVRNQLTYLKDDFTTPSFNNLCGIVRGCLKRQGRSTLSNMANDTGKCISAMSYFFNGTAWNITEVRDTIRRHCILSPLTKIEDGDIAAVDESSVSKKGSHFEFIGKTWDNADKEIHDGYTFLGLAIVSAKKNVRWLFDEVVYSNEDPKFRGIPIYLLRLLRRLFAQTTITTIVFDSGFKYQYVFKYILEQSRHFIVRATVSMVVHTRDKKQTSKLLNISTLPGTQTYALEVNGQKGWSISWCTGFINAWLRVIKVPLTVVVITRPSFRKPMILITSLPISTTDDAIAVYQNYLNRWKIEILFQEIKTLGLESFRVRKKVAILKFITVMILLHTLVTLQTQWLKLNTAFADVVTAFLRKHRKIKQLCFGGTKILYEFLLTGQLKLPDLLENISPRLAVNLENV
jgi:hypothetical protein